MKENRKTETCEMKVIARIHTDFPEKFGIPRQSGLVRELEGKIVFEPEYRNPQALKGLEEFSHIWILWEFSQSICTNWSPTVRPPRLGGNVRKGVFATRSPFRPNPIGLSSVCLEKIVIDAELGPVLYVRGADLMDGTPIFDIKPYVPHSDCHPDADGGFSDRHKDDRLCVKFPEHLEALVPEEKREALRGVLENDPRPAYHKDSERVYGFGFAGMDVHFQVKDGCLIVCGIETQDRRLM